MKRFFSDIRGNTAIIFALSAVPLILMTGGVTDVVNAYSVKAKLQSSVDAAALEAAAAQGLSDQERKQAALDSFKANFTGNLVKGLKATPTAIIHDEDVTVDVTTSVPTHFLKLVSINSLDVKVKAVVKRSYGSMEVALVLDNTKSMNGSKMAALKSASKDLVKSLFKNSARDKLHVSVVPYAQYVNVGTDKRGAFWLNVPDDRTVTTPASCKMVWTYKKTDCYDTTCYRWEDGETKSYSCQKCNWVKDRKVRKCTPAGSYDITWEGCVGSRAHPLNVEDTDPGNRIPGIMDTWCQRPILPLSTDEDTVLGELDDMTAEVNGTYIPGGLMWGWRALSSAEPYTEGVTPETASKKKVTKAIVLMTDGVNTCDPDYATGEHECGKGRGATANTLTAEACTNIKKAGIRIYSVAFDVKDGTTKDMLKSCASDASSYFDAKDNEALKTAFNKIGRSLASIYLSQ